MTGLKLLAESLEESLDSDPEQARIFAAQLRRETERLTRLTNDLLDLAHLEGEGPGNHEELVDVRGVLMTVLSSMRRAAREKGVSLNWRRFGRASRYTIRGDETQLVSMFTNLIDNAIKYTSPGGTVEVTGGLDEVPGGFEEGRSIFVSISDTGLGIPEGNLPRIFERFYRVDKARSKATGGTGLGLSIVRHVVENHGGRITVESVEGEGTTFTVHLPGDRPPPGP